MSGKSTTYAAMLEHVPVARLVPEPVDLQPAIEKLQSDINELKATQKELHREIRELKELLKASLKKD